MRRWIGVLAALLLALQVSCAAAAATPTDTPSPTATATSTATATASSTAVPPSATPTTADGVIDVAPTTLQLAGDTNFTGGMTITVIGRGLPARAALWIELMGTKPDGEGFSVRLNDHDAAVTDAGGHVRWQGPLRGTLEAGTDTIDVHLQDGLLGENDGRLLGRATLTLTTPPGPCQRPGVFCLGPLGPLDLGAWTASWMEGALAWWNTLTQHGRASLWAQLWSNAVLSVDPGVPPYSGIMALATPWAQLGTVIFLELIALRLIAEMAGWFKGRLEGWRMLLTLLELSLVVSVWRSVPGVEHQIAAFSARWTANLARAGADRTLAALDHLTTIKQGDLASLANWGLGLVVALCLLVLFVYLLALVILTKIGGLGLFLFTAIMGGFCVPFFILPATRGVALWWARTYLALSSWSVVYAYLGVAGGLIAATLTDGAGLAWHDALPAMAAGLALVGAFAAVPQMCRWFWGHATGGTVSAVGDARIKLESWLQRHTPLYGGLGLRG